MRFGSYLHQKAISEKDAATALKRHIETIRNWVRGENLPRKAEVEAIYVWTDGEVGPDDWYDLPPLDAEAVVAAAHETPLAGEAAA